MKSVDFCLKKAKEDYVKYLKLKGKHNLSKVYFSVFDDIAVEWKKPVGFETYLPVKHLFLFSITFIFTPPKY